MSRKQRKQRQQKLMYLGFAGVMAASVAAVLLMGMVNSEASGSRYTYTTENDIWFVDDGEIQLAAPTGEMEDGGFFVSDAETNEAQSPAEPTAEPTQEPAR